MNYALFFDNHTPPLVHDVGSRFDADRFTDELLRCHVDHLTFHARCNQGFAYYDTKIGIRHPGLQPDRDLFGELADACEKKNISLVAYLNGGLSHAEGQRHRDWLTIDCEGRIYHKIGGAGFSSPFFRMMCRNSPYRDHLIDMISEIASRYPVRGFFIDCLIPAACICPICVELMKKEGVDWRDPAAVKEFARRSVLRLCRDIDSAVRQKIASPVMYFNGPAYGTMKGLDTYFDCECLPTAGWGYEFLPAAAHYAHALRRSGVEVLNMTGRFYDWGDFGSLRSAPSLEYDLAYGLAHGLRPNIGGHFHPRGDLDQPVFDCIAEVYHKLQRCDAYYRDARNLADAALVCQESELHDLPAVTAAIRMLEELKIQFDVVCDSDDPDFSAYRLIIVPEHVSLSDDFKKAIRRAAASGSSIFACGRNGAEAFGQELGVESAEPADFTPVYIQPDQKYADRLPEMPLSLYAEAFRAEPSVSGRPSGTLIRPFNSYGWDGIADNTYNPPEKSASMPLLIEGPSGIYFAGDFFTGYSVRFAMHLRNLFSNMLKKTLLPKPVLENISLPSFVRCSVTVQKTEKRTMVHLISFIPERRMAANVVEEGISVVDGTFRLRCPGVPEKVYLAPEGRTVPFEMEEGYAAVTLPHFKGSALLVFENPS